MLTCASSIKCACILESEYQQSQDLADYINKYKSDNGSLENIFDDIDALDELDSKLSPENKIILNSTLEVRKILIEYKNDIYKQHKDQEILLEQNKLLLAQVSQMQVMMQQQQMQMTQFMSLFPIPSNEV